MYAIVLMLLALTQEPEESLELFPSEDDCHEQIMHWQRHLEWLGRMKAAATRRDQYAVWEKQTRQHIAAWKQLKEAHRPTDGWQPNRDTALANLKANIGIDAYMQGRMPTIPTWVHPDPPPVMQRVPAGAQ